MRFLSCIFNICFTSIPCVISIRVHHICRLQLLYYSIVALFTHWFQTSNWSKSKWQSCNSEKTKQLYTLDLSIWLSFQLQHYCDVMMGAVKSQITSLTIVYSTLYSDVDQRKHQSSASLAFVRGIHRGPVNSPHKWPVTRKMFPFDDVIMKCLRLPFEYFKIWQYIWLSNVWGCD